jgi:tetratricopeptide (TPR) repeat protein
VTVLFPSADVARISEILKEAQQFATTLNDSTRLGQIANFLLMIDFVTGDHQRAMDAEGEAATCKDIGIQAVHYLYLGLSAQALGQYAEAIALFRKTIVSLRDGLIRERFGQVVMPGVFQAFCAAAPRGNDVSSWHIASAARRTL